MADPINPLTKEQQEELVQKLKDCDLAQQQIDMAKRAGIPIGDAEAQLRETRAQLKKLKDVYAPSLV